MTNHESEWKEVYFNVYCQQCEHWKKYDTDEPCFTCLDNAVNQHTHRPTEFKQRSGKATGQDDDRC